MRNASHQGLPKLLGGPWRPGLLCLRADGSLASLLCGFDAAGWEAREIEGAKRAGNQNCSAKGHIDLFWDV